MSIPEQLPPGPARFVIGSAIGELGGEQELLTLVRGYAAEGRPFDGTLNSVVEGLALGKQPSDHWRGAYELYPVDVAPLRKQLFGLLDGVTAQLAEACLTAIDELRDEHGRVESEPRHPDIASGRPWPLSAEVVQNCQSDDASVGA